MRADVEDVAAGTGQRGDERARRQTEADQYKNDRGECDSFAARGGEVGGFVPAPAKQ
jgi:hypothetical protein